MARSAVIYNESLRENIEGLLSQLRTAGYSEVTLNNYLRLLRPIQTYMDENHIQDFTPEVGDKYLEQYLRIHSPGEVQRREIRATIMRLKDYYNGTAYSIHHSSVVLDCVPDSFITDASAFFGFCLELGNSARTIKRKKRAVARFLSKCHLYGIKQVQGLNPQCVLLACRDIRDTDEWPVIRPFLQFLSKKYEGVPDLSTFVPVFRREKKLPSTFSIEEIKALEAAIDRSTLIGKRNYAMILLASRLGIRAGDIVSLRHENMDFEGKKISFIQQKTGNEITLAMVPDVWDALCDYIRQKPTSAEGIVFLRTMAPYSSLSNNTVFDIISKGFRLAGIDLAGRKHGPHALRASLSTSMVNDDIPYAAVRSILGHSSMDSIKYYAKTDLEKLRRCAISVPAATGNFYEFLKEAHK